jgi:hypothetical protein
MKPKPVFADPKTDVIFKKIFGEKAHKNLLLELLNSLLELDEAHRIVDVDYLTPEQLPPRNDLKLSILDVKCIDARGTHYVVEMQVIEVEGFQKRIVYNACKAYSTQLGVSDDYPQLNDVIAVTLCDFVLWPQRSERETRGKCRCSVAGGCRNSTAVSAAWARSSTCSWSYRSIKPASDRAPRWTSGRTSSASRRAWSAFPKSCRKAPMPRHWKSHAEPTCPKASGKSTSEPRWPSKTFAAACPWPRSAVWNKASRKASCVA